MSFTDKPNNLDVAVNVHTPLGADPERVYPLTEGAGTDVRNLGSAVNTDPADDTFDMVIRDWDTDDAALSPTWVATEGGGVTLVGGGGGQYMNIAGPIAGNLTYAHGHIRLRISVASFPANPTKHIPILHTGTGGLIFSNAGFVQGLCIAVSSTYVTAVTRTSGGSTLQYYVLHSASGVVAGTAFDIDVQWGGAGFQFWVNGVVSDSPGTHTEGIIDRQGGYGMNLGLPFESSYSEPNPFTVLDYTWTNDDGDDDLAAADRASLREDPHWPMRKRAPFALYDPQLTVRPVNAPNNVCAALSLAVGADTIDLQSLVDATTPPSSVAFGVQVAQGAAPLMKYIPLHAIAGAGARRYYSIQYRWPNAGNTFYDLRHDSVETGKTTAGVIIGSFEDVQGEGRSRFAFGSDAHSNEAPDTAIPWSNWIEGGALLSPPLAGMAANLQVAIAAGAALFIDGGDRNWKGDAEAGYPPPGEHDPQTQEGSDAWELDWRNVVLRDLLPHIPILNVLGNHEGVASYQETNRDVRIETIERYVPNPAGGTGSTFNNYGSVVFGLAEHFWIDPYTRAADTGYTANWALDEDQENWLIAAIEASTALYKFVHCHQLIGGYGTYGRGGPNVATVLREGTYQAVVLHPVFVANGVNAYFYGHDHGFAHGLVGEPGAQVHYIVGGAIGRKFTGSVYADGRDAAYGYAGPNVRFADSATGIVLVTMDVTKWSFQFIRTYNGVNYGLRQVIYQWPNMLSIGIRKGLPMNFVAMDSLTATGVDQAVVVPRDATLMVHPLLADVEIRNETGSDAKLTISGDNLVLLGPSLGQTLYLKATEGTTIELALT